MDDALVDAETQRLAAALVNPLRFYLTSPDPARWGLAKAWTRSAAGGGRITRWAAADVAVSIVRGVFAATGRDPVTLLPDPASVARDPGLDATSAAAIRDALTAMRSPEESLDPLWDDYASGRVADGQYEIAMDIILTALCDLLLDAAAATGVAAADIWSQITSGFVTSAR